MNPRHFVTSAPRCWTAADIGARSNQEDAHVTLVGGPPHVFVVADGMGGHRGGEVASRLVVEAFKSRLMRCSDEALVFLANAVPAANEAILREGERKRELRGMGSTVVALALGSDGAAVAHVGDSRCYRLRGQQLNRLTEDHAPTDVEIAAGAEAIRAMYRSAGDSEEVMAARVARHDARHRSLIYRALGTKRGERGDVQRVDARPGDRFLLCSDGLESLPLEVVAELLAGAKPAESLVGAALALCRPHQDNVTAVVVAI